MPQELYSVEQVADLLNLHVRTVRNYVREGRLQAVRIGKQYRIAREDLEAVTGRPAAALERGPVGRTRYVEISSIVEIDALSPHEANRMTNGLMGTAKGHGPEDPPLRVETIYNEERSRLKIIFTGSLASVGGLLRLVEAYLKG